MNEIIAQRQFTPMYIYLDTVFLIVLAILLLTQKKVYDGDCRFGCRCTLYAGRLWHLSFTLSHPQYQ